MRFKPNKPMFRPVIRVFFISLYAANEIIFKCIFSLFFVSSLVRADFVDFHSFHLILNRSDKSVFSSPLS